MKIGIDIGIPMSGSGLSILGQLQGIGVGGLTFFKDYRPNVPSLNADFAVGSEVATYTAARSAGAPSTYVDANGVIQLLTTANVRRRQGGYYDATGFHAQSGEMIEAAGTNLLINTAFDSNTAWSTNNLTYSGNIRWSGIASNGGANTYSISDTEIIGGSVPVITVTTAGPAITDNHFRTSTASSVSLTSGTVYSVSFYVKTDVAKTLTVDVINTDDNSNLGLVDTFITVANTWIRITKSFTANASVTSKARLRFNLGNNGLFVFYISKLQIELSPYATSFIPTTTAALTRAADATTTGLKYALSGNRTVASETMFLKFVPGQTWINDGLTLRLTITGIKQRLAGKGTTSTVITARPNSTDDGSGRTLTSTTTPLINTSYVFAVAMSHTSPYGELYINGISQNTLSGDWTNPTTWAADFSIGTDLSGLNQLNGIIQGVAFFNRALTAPEVLAVTNILNSN
jgi:hypothetical protein